MKFISMPFCHNSDLVSFSEYHCFGVPIAIEQSWAAGMNLKRCGFVVVSSRWIRKVFYVSSAVTVEKLLTDREAWQKEREQVQSDNVELHSQQNSDGSEIDRLRRIIASLQHKLFVNKKGEHVDTAQWQMQLSGAEKTLVQLEAQEQVRELRDEPAAKTAFINDLTKIIGGSNFILASCVVEKQRLHETTDTPDNPYHIALLHCMLSLYDFLVEKREQAQLTHVIVEQRGGKEDKKLELEFRRICDGKNPRNIRLPFEILFANKKAMSSGLQLADLVARPIGLHVLRPKQVNRSFDALKDKFYCEGGRHNAGAGFDGWGLKIEPPGKSEGSR